MGETKKKKVRMVREKLGPIISIIGSQLVIGFNIFYLIMWIWEANLIESEFIHIIHIELVYIGFVTALVVGAAGIIGGLLALSGKRLANVISLSVGTFAVVGISVPIGRVGVVATFPSSSVVWTPITMLWTFIYIDVILVFLGGALGLLLKSDFKSKIEQKSAKRDKLLLKVEKMVFDYLEGNKGNAFTVKSLHKRVIEANQFDISILETKKILNDMYLLGKCHLDFKENMNYYFIPE